MRKQTRGAKHRLEFCSERELVGILAALERSALKRLAAELEGALGSGWEGTAAGIASLLFGFDSLHREIGRYTEVMSKVLRWLRGEVEAACAWPVDVDRPSCCVLCYQKAMARGMRA